MGFPIQRSQDQGLVASSPEHIAGSHVFHRLSTPRHPPHALNSLITSTQDRSSLPPDAQRHRTAQTVGAVVDVTRRATIYSTATRRRLRGICRTAVSGRRAGQLLKSSCLGVHLRATTWHIHLSKTTTPLGLHPPESPAQSGSLGRPIRPPDPHSRANFEGKVIRVVPSRAS